MPQASAIDRLKNNRYAAKQQVPEVESHVPRSSKQYTRLNIANQRGRLQLKFGHPGWLDHCDGSAQRPTDERSISGISDFDYDTLAEGRPADGRSDNREQAHARERYRNVRLSAR